MARLDQRLEERHDDPAAAAGFAAFRHQRHATAERDEAGRDFCSIARHALAEQFEQPRNQDAESLAVLAVQLVVTLRECRLRKACNCSSTASTAQPGSALIVPAHFSMPAMVLAASLGAWVNTASTLARSSD